MSQPFSFSIQPVQYSDYVVLDNIGRESCLTDRQTQLKKLGNISYLQDNDKAEKYKDFVKTLQTPKHVYLKAVQNGLGEVLGSLHFVFYGFKDHQLPSLPERGNLNEIETHIRELETQDAKAEPESEETKKKETDPEKRRINDAIDRFEAMESADFRLWQSVIMPSDSGCRCLIIAGFFVATSYQGKGIGSALLRYATEMADEHGVFMWVHSSEAAWRAYEKAGFAIVRMLEVDLDEWAPVSPPEGGKWGRYVIRYMKRDARVVNTQGDRTAE
jgi:GNAT superfamily N-acetyltransferase